MSALVRLGAGKRPFFASSRLAATASLIAVLTASALASAQADITSKAAAEGLFDQGRELMKKGDFKAACGYLERSQQIDPAVGTLLYLAECYEKAGRIASAWATFREAASSARAIGQVERARLGDERAARLTPILPRLAIEVPEAVRAIPGLVVKRQGQPVPAAAWDVAVPLDAGQYRIDASAPGYKDFSGTVQVGGDASIARISIPPLVAIEGAASATPVPDSVVEPSTTAAVAPASPPPPSAAEPVRHSSSPQRTLSYVVGGVGLVGIGLGSFFGLRAISKNDDAKELCPQAGQCADRKGVTLSDDADKAATLSNVSFALGAAALAGGVVLYLTAPDGSSEAAPTVGAALTPSGVWLTGAF